MANNAYCAIALTGGGTGALDSLDGANLADGDVCFVVDAANNNFETYTLNATLGGVAVPPSTVSPTTNAGNKRWELVKGVFKDSLSIYDGTNIGLVQLITNILELYSNKTSGVVRVSVTDVLGNKETAADFTGGGAARLYYDNAVKLATTTTGVTVTGALNETIPAFSRRNVLINGGFVVAQRGISFSANGMTVDRWRLSHNASTVTIGQSNSNIAPFYNRSIVRMTLTTKGGSFSDFAISHPLESRDSFALVGQAITFSVYLRRNSTFNAGNVKSTFIQVREQMNKR